MKEIIVVTGNKRKVRQAQDAMEPFGITVTGESVHVDEIQTPGTDVHGVAVARRKAQDAFAALTRPLIVCDQHWEIPALGGFPGAYMKDMDRLLKPDDVLAMLEGKDRTIHLYENVVYTDGNITKDFTAVYNGTMAAEPRGVDGDWSGKLIIYEGTDMTIAEHRDRGEHARDMGQSAWKLFGEWYADQEQE
ncbi:hypothetical protein KC973_01410 [Candidatus Saccharibacteria bacterium]|nr:hypothetical protein [Candidatus Saccharibacteria bacterium]